MKTLNFLQLNKKFDLKALSKAEKKKFYLQELFYGQAYIKKYLLVLFLLVVVGQSANSSGYLEDKENKHGKERWTVTGTFALAVVGIFSSIIISFLKNSQNLIKYQIASFVIGTAATFACVFARFYGLCSRASTTPGIHLFIEGVSMSANGFYMTRFLDLLSPYWYLRLVAPSAYFIGWLISTSQIEGQPNSSLYINCTFGIINLVLVNWLHASFRWNIFTNRIESDIWNDIHRVILQKVPSPIAVFDIKGQVTYANPEFNRLSENQADKLFEKITSLKQRQQMADEEGSSISFERIFEDISPEASNKSKSYHTKPSLFTERVQNLTKLLDNAIELLSEEKVDDNAYFVFDGKIPETTDSKGASFEVTLSFIIEYQKIVIILRDTTDHAQLVVAETSNEYKDKLLASVSHELRTPLNGNLSLIQATLSDSSVPEAVKERFLVPAYRSGKLLMHLINDILDFSQIAAKKLRLNFEEQPIRDTIMSCYQLLELQAKAKEIEFKLDLPDHLPLFKTDHDRVRQIILNLLGNALKFTFQGGITLKVTNLGQGQLEIKVEDTGIGIKPEDLGKLFREFTRIDNPNQITMNTKGVGLGLTIANKLAKRLGPFQNQAGINVRSTYGEGSSFKFIIMDKSKEKEIMSLDPTSEKLAFAQTDAIYPSLPSIDPIDQTSNHFVRKYFLDISAKFKKQASQEQNRSSSVDLEYIQLEKNPKNILIVDDEPFNILALESFLKSSDVNIETAFNGKIAVDKVKKRLETNEQYDLIFMDCQMPIMDGLEATKELRSIGQGSYSIPIIGCTAFNSDQTIKLCYTSGMTQVLKKPLSKAEVEKIIKTFL